MMKSIRMGGVPQIMKAGTEQLSGLQEAVIKNLTAGKELADVLRPSMGPNGMNKMLINHLGKLFITSDCATILSEMEIQHPAAKMILLAARMQEQEIGDGCNYVVCIAGELLAKAEELIRIGLHPSEIISGYNKAGKRALELLEELSVFRVDSKQMTDKAVVAKAISSVIASKQFGVEDFLSNLIVDACLNVMPANPGHFAVDNVRVCKIMGGSYQQSEVIRGMVIAHDTIGSIKKATDAKVAVFSGSIEGASTETKGTILLENADDLLKYSSSEEQEIEKLIKAISEGGVKVVVTGGSIDDMAAHYLEKYGLMALKVSSKHDLRRLCRAVGAVCMPNLGPVSPEQMGHASVVYVREVGAKKITILEQERGSSGHISTVLLRASTEHFLNDLERAVDDGVNVVRAMGRDGRFLAGAGAVEIELARAIKQLAATTPGLDQYAIKNFAEAFEIVPRTLAENAGQNGVEALAALYAAHEKKDGTSTGINVEDGGVRDAAKAQILDLLSTKSQALRLAIDAAVTILRVDQIISSKPAGGPKVPSKSGNWDED